LLDEIAVCALALIFIIIVMSPLPSVEGTKKLMSGSPSGEPVTSWLAFLGRDRTTWLSLAAHMNLFKCACIHYNPYVLKWIKVELN
jgi:hypothetical protein